MTTFVNEPARQVPVTGQFDVAVVGGGIAGVAAAVAAARNGASVCLIEKECALGGLATLGNVVEYLPLCDGNGNQVIKGLGEELLLLSVKDGYREVPACWRAGGEPAQRREHRYRVRFNPASFILGLEEFIAASGVTLYYDTRFSDVIRDDDRITAVIVESKSGRTAFACRAVVDASGDADVCARAGEDTVSLGTNSASGWFYYDDGTAVQLVPLYTPYDPYGKVMPDGSPGFYGDSAEQVTAQVLETRRLTRLRLQKIAKEQPTRRIFPVLLPTVPGVRMTRRLHSTLDLDEPHERQVFPDSVGMTGDWRKKGPVYYVPFRTLTGVRTANLAAAGRCMSAGTTWDVMRAIPSGAVTGQAAGTAAALLARQGQTARFADLDIRALQETLRQQNVPVDMPVPPATPGNG